MGEAVRENPRRRQPLRPPGTVANNAIQIYTVENLQVPIFHWFSNQRHGSHQLLLLGLLFFLFVTDLFSFFTPPPPKASSHHHHPHPAKPPINVENLDNSLLKPSAVGGIGYDSTVKINFCASCSYRGIAVTTKNMVETQFP